MEENLRTHMDNLFEVVPKTDENLELKEEILQNLIDKYHDLLNEGKSEEVAFSIAISSVGDIRELLGDMSSNNPNHSGGNAWQSLGANNFSGNGSNHNFGLDSFSIGNGQTDGAGSFSGGNGQTDGAGSFSGGSPEQDFVGDGFSYDSYGQYDGANKSADNGWQDSGYSSEGYSYDSGYNMNNDIHSSYEQEYAAWKKRSAFFVSGAVMLYILSVVPPIVLDMFDLDNIGAVAMFILIAIATGLLIYNKNTQPTPPRSSGNMVKDFKKWQKESNENHKLYKSLNDMLWCIIVALYFIISFTVGAWHITWVIFLIGSALSSALKAIIDLTNPQNKN